MPRSYFLSVDPAQAARHFSLIAPAVGANEVRSAAVGGDRPGAYELLVVAVDRPGLLSWIAGSLSLAGLSILTAQAFTTDDGVAVDLFEVEGAFEPEIHEERWREFRTVLRKVLEGRISLEHRVEEKRRHYPPPRRPSPVTVRVDQEASDFFTVIEVGAPDRIGLLYDITRTLADLHLDVHLAKVATYTDRVIDAFYVRDELGRKVQDPAQVGRDRGGVPRAPRSLRGLSDAARQSRLFENSTCHRHERRSSACSQARRMPASPPGRITTRPRSSSVGQPSSSLIRSPSRTRKLIGPGAPRSRSSPRATTEPSAPRTSTPSVGGAACTSTRSPATAPSTLARAKETPVAPAFGNHRSQISSVTIDLLPGMMGKPYPRSPPPDRLERKHVPASSCPPDEGGATVRW